MLHRRARRGVHVLMWTFLALCALFVWGPTSAESPVAHRFGGALRPQKPAPRGTATRAAGVAAAPGCPTDMASWTTWRDRAIEQLLMPRPKMENQVGPFLDASQVAAQSVAVVNFLNDCDPDATAKPAISSLWDFTDTQSLGLDVYHQFAHGLDDLAYVERVKGIAQLPCLLQSPEFLLRISDPASYKQAADMISEQNQGRVVGQCPPDGNQWQSLFYKSAYLGTPDSADAFGRFLVVVPGTTHDLWIQFGIWTPGEVPSGGVAQSLAKINNVSVVAAAKRRVAGDGRFNVALDWWRTYDGPSIRLSTRREATGGTGNCQQCHKTAVIGIHPAEIFRPDQSGKLVPAPELQPNVDALNKLIRGKDYRFPTQAVFDVNNVDAAAEPIRYGPGLGPDEDDRLTRKADLMKACTAPHGLNDVSVTRVSKSMNCAQCHNDRPNGHGLINFPMATQMTKAQELKDGKWPNLVYHYIKRGLMPPPEIRVTDPPLNEPEKEALFDCLALEYHDVAKTQGLFVDWLKNGPQKRPERDAETLAMLVRAMTRDKPAATPRGQRIAMAQGGAADFADRCARCHSLIAGDNGTGPSLKGVFDRLAGTASGFDYSVSYVKAGQLGVKWNEANLKAFLIDQPAFLSQKIGSVAESEMDKHYPDEALRSRIVEFLRTQQ